MIHQGRYSAAVDGDLVVFLIGARVHRWWRIPTLLRVSRAMDAMQAELRAQPELGCLNIENWGGRTTISVQYWRSAEALIDYARSKDSAHLPAWKHFNQVVRKTGAVGVWHETYAVARSEAMYVDMPRFGLARAGRHFEVGAGSSARERLAS